MKSIQHYISCNHKRKFFLLMTSIMKTHTTTRFLLFSIKEIISLFQVNNITRFIYNSYKKKIKLLSYHRFKDNDKSQYKFGQSQICQ